MIKAALFSGIFGVLLFLASFQIMAQTSFNYEAAWQNIEKNIQEGKPRTAMDALDKLYTQAKKDGLDAWQIKAIITRSTLFQAIEEDSWLKTAAYFEQELKTASAPVKQLLYSTAGDMYQAYFDNQRWKIYDRTVTSDTDPANPETWNAADFSARISACYTQSVEQPELLQKISLEAYAPIITRGNVRHLRPTLYDLLAHKALAYWQNENSDITRPAYAFELNDAASFAPSKTFIRYGYQSRDSNSHTFKAIRLYQELVRFHLNDTKPDALIDVEINRITFAYEQSTNPFKAQLYKEALEHIYTQYPNNEQAMQAGYLLAAWWQNKGDAYIEATGTETTKMAYAIALDYADKVAEKFPESAGSINAATLAANIRKPLLKVTVENVNEKAKPFRALLQFKNTTKVYLKVVAWNPEKDNHRRNRYEEAWWKSMVSLPAIRSWSIDLPAFADYRMHSAEIKVDALPHGSYMILASSKADFALSNHPLTAATFFVSNISYVYLHENYFILDRSNGRPLDGATVQVWEMMYDYNERMYKKQKQEKLSADKNGQITVKKLTQQQRNSNEYRLEITTPNDYLMLDETLYRTYYYKDASTPAPDAWEKQQADYTIFTDRSIYRPGQPVYFKAIGLTRDKATGKPKIFIPAQLKVLLRNANFELVDTLLVKPSKYGSIQGRFMLPENGLNGVFSVNIMMDDQTWQQPIQVEAYKRPQFYVQFDTLKNTFKLNREIHITGSALGYAGQNIDGAQVVWRVHRNTRFLYPWRLGYGYGRQWPPVHENTGMEIAHGIGTTKPDGSFDINFTALPDLLVDKKSDPVFDYTIEAVVTDINGETRSNTTHLSVGYTSLNLRVDRGPSLYIPSDSSINLKVHATNLMGTPVAANVHIEVYALLAPDRLIKARYWQTPDTFILSKSAFIAAFPNDPYKNEDQYEQWDTGTLMYKADLATPQQTGTMLPHTKWNPGYYKLIATTIDDEGNSIRNEQYICIFNSKSSQLPAPAYTFLYGQKDMAEPGEKAVYLSGTSAPAPFIIENIQKENPDKSGEAPAANTFRFYTAGKGIQRNAFDVTEYDRGGYLVQRVFVYHNRFYVQTLPVKVPWSNKKLQINLATYRDKLKPGQEETLKVTISGTDKEKVAAEMLASMYDASLDQFTMHQWRNIHPWANNHFEESWSSGQNFIPKAGQEKWWDIPHKTYTKTYDQLMAFNRYSMLTGRIRGVMSAAAAAPVEESMVLRDKLSDEVLNETVMVAYTLPKIVNDSVPGNGIEKGEGNAQVQIRKDFRETAFFFPDLKTDTAGNISFGFTMPEALTTWKLQMLAHTTDARFAYSSHALITQKELMVLPNAPRFVRQGDQLELSVKISNLTDKELTGQVTLELINPATMQPVDGWFMNVFPNQYFTAPASQSTAVKFPMHIPYLYHEGLLLRVIARAGNISDGEEMIIPVLTNRMLVTESFPIYQRGAGQQSFVWERFKTLNAPKDEPVDNQKLTLEYTTNPAWNALQALPYLMEYPYDCAEQTWNRFYANALAGKIASSVPSIQAVLDTWKHEQPDALLSNLQKNRELKSVLLEETPWVLDAKNEAAQKQQIALLFDMVKMSSDAENALSKLAALQSPNGGFVWFKGGPDDRYITQYILSGIGHLKKLNALPESQKSKLADIVQKALPYADARLKDAYDQLLKNKADLNRVQLSSFEIQYLYMRSFFPEIPVADAAQKAVTFFRQQAGNYWLQQSKYHQGMIALALHRTGNQTMPKKILTSLKENSIQHPEMGMYWKEFNNPGYYWWQAPIESHALLMEAFFEIDPDATRMDDMKTWLLRQKQTTNWKTTKATAEACYALLMQGNNWLMESKAVVITLGNKVISSNTAIQEAGTGYFKTTIEKHEIQPEMGNIKISAEAGTQLSSTSWGALYWQYFEDLDKITSAETGVSIKKTLYLQKNTDRGPVLEKLETGMTLQVGDRVKVRMEITNDRNMEYVHIKDMRASSFEPVHVLSGYRYQGGLGYYETTRDASNNFFVGYLPRGTWIFEYELRATHKGNFSNGITTMQCMYAPEFSTHSEGSRVHIE